MTDGSQVSLMPRDDLRDALLETMESALDAQLRAVRRLRFAPASRKPSTPSKGMSQINMAFDILAHAEIPLHVNVLIERIKQRFDVVVDRESLVSALSKKVIRGDRFQRTEKNTFALLESPLPKP